MITRYRNLSFINMPINTIAFSTSLRYCDLQLLVCVWQRSRGPLTEHRICFIMSYFSIISYHMLTLLYFQTGPKQTLKYLFKEIHHILAFTITYTRVDFLKMNYKKRYFPHETLLQKPLKGCFSELTNVAAASRLSLRSLFPPPRGR